MAIECHQEGSLNSHKIALWVSNGDVSVTSGRFILQRRDVRPEGKSYVRSQTWLVAEARQEPSSPIPG